MPGWGRWEGRIALALVLVTMVGQVGAADCLKDTRETAIGSAPGSPGVRLRQYLCEKPGVGRVSVEFNRLNDLAATLLLSGRAPTALKREFGAVRIVHNEVSAEFARLLDLYGEAEPEGDATLTATSPNGESGNAGRDVLRAAKVLVAAQGDARPIDFPDHAALNSLVSVATVPPRYRAAGSDFVNTVLIWRYMDADDLANYPVLVQAYNRTIGAPRFEGQFRGFQTGNIPSHIRLYRDLAEGGLPGDFVTIFGERDLGPMCGFKKYWEFKFYPRELVVDFAVVHNRGTVPVTVSALLGAVGGGRTLRAPTAMPTGAGAQTRIALPQAVRLEPDQRLAVATKLTWVLPDAFRDRFSAEKVSPPADRPYAWGAEWRVAGLVVDGQPLSLEGGAANYFAVTTSCECGSCPYLYAWEAGGGWRNTGKIIDKAMGADRQLSETRSFAGAVTRFRLVEHEAELARIDRVALAVRLASGRVVDVPTTEPPLRQADGRYVDLAMGDSIEFRFTLPRSLRRERIVESQLTVTGYYDRYSDVLAARHGPPRQALTTGYVGRFAAVAQPVPADACPRPVQ